MIPYDKYLNNVMEQEYSTWDTSSIEYQFTKIDDDHEAIVALWKAHLEFIMPSDFGTPDDGLSGVVVA
jgi:hypothetical protein